MQVHGVKAALAELKTVDNEYRKQAVKDIKKAATPLITAAREMIPTAPPLSGMARGRLAWKPTAKSKVGTKVGGSARGRASFALISLRQNDGAGSVFDFAGRSSQGNTPHGAKMIATLDERFGKASRSMWPGAEKAMPQVQQVIVEILEKVMRRVSRNLQRG